MSKRKHSSSVEQLPHDVVMLILERLPVKSLMTFRSVSKQWKSTIESQRFQQVQFNLRRQSRGPDFLYVSYGCRKVEDETRRVPLGSSLVSMVRFPAVSRAMVCHGSCDGLICLFFIHTPSIVVNPATGWHRSFPLSTAQHILSNMYRSGSTRGPYPKLGFGKDEFSGTFKPVWLCNSSEFGLDSATTCQVFDFSIDAWRNVRPASPFRILDHQKPVYLGGSLYWLTACEETNVLSFDLHTETFQVVSKTPFPHVRSGNPRHVIMCILENRLCVSEKTWPTQVIWSLDSSKAWKKVCSLDITKTFGCSLFREGPALLPLSILEDKKLLLQGVDLLSPMVMYDLHTKSYDLVFYTQTCGYPVSYFQSLFSASSY